MDLCDKYLFDFINIYPPMNDYLLYSKFTKNKVYYLIIYLKVLLKKKQN